jgi:glycerate 2-kinase
VKELLRRLFAETLLDLDPKGQMAKVVDEWRERAERGAPFLVLAFGKAARAMAQALVDGWPGANLRGLVVPPEPDDAPLPPFEVIPGGHPLPSPGSMHAATRALELARGATRDDVVLFLASGGGSAMLELPADPTVTIEQLRTFYQALVGSGAGIVEINTVRRHVSAVKGGRLALAAARAAVQVTVEISDVPDLRGASVASGPSTLDPTTLADCRAVLDRFELWPIVPAALRTRIQSGELPPPLRADGPAMSRLVFRRIGSNDHARAAMRRHAAAAGLSVFEDQSVDDHPYELAATRLLEQLDQLHYRDPGRAVAVLTGGELSVPLARAPGVGGRNQQFALACALKIRHCPITVLSAGTDGVDGNSTAAGAIVDGTTVLRAKALGFSVPDALARFDAFPLLHALGDTVITGPTGTNVRDLRLLVHAG